MTDSDSNEGVSTSPKRWLSILSKIFILTVLAGIFVYTCVYIQSRMSGWAEVAERYPYEGTENSQWSLDGLADISSSGFILENAGAGGAKIDELGLYLDSSLPIFNPFHPIFIPWESVRSVRRCNILPDSHVIVRVNVENEKTDIEFRGNLAKLCQDTAELKGVSVTGPDPDAMIGLH